MIDVKEVKSKQVNRIFSWLRWSETKKNVNISVPDNILSFIWSYSNFAPLKKLKIFTKNWN